MLNDEGTGSAGSVRVPVTPPMLCVDMFLPVLPSVGCCALPTPHPVLTHTNVSFLGQGQG